MRREDSPLRWVLAGGAVGYLCGALVTGLLRQGSFWLLAGSMFGGIFVLGVTLPRVLRGGHSERAALWFLVSILVFQAWTGVAFWIGLLALSPGSPAYALGLLEASAAVPLVAGALAMTRQLRSVT